MRRRFSLRILLYCLANAATWFLTQPVQEEFIMSSRNGDRSRFHRVRKQKIARRKRTHELLESSAAQAKPVNRAPAAAQRSVPA